MSKSTQKPLVLVDGSSYLFRAYFALPPLTNSKGRPTGAIYGVVSMLKRLVTDYQPEHVAVVFDPKGKSFRNDLYSEYKANRATMPNELREQIQPLFEIIEALGFPLIIKEGFEADDVIATLTRQAEQQDMDVLISTGDKDLAQLVNDRVTLINTMNNRLLDPTGVKEKFGVSPEQIVDYLTLVGDSSDNIPGVPKVGPKTAAKWLQQYDSLDNLVKHANEITGKVGEYLRDNLKTLPVTRQLVTLISDVALAIQPQELSRQEKDQKKLIELFTELEFKTWLSELLAAEKETPAALPYTTIYDKKTFQQWLKKLENSEEFSFDTETTDLNAMQAQLVGVSFSVQPGEAAYVPLGHDYEGAPKQLDRAWVLQQLTPLLNNKEKTLVGQNLKYDLQVLAQYDIRVNTKLLDTLLESYVLNSTGTRRDLDTLSLKYLGKSTIKFEDIAGKGVKQLTFNQVSVEKAAYYASEDADIALQLHHKLMPMLSVDKKLLDVLNTIEMPLMPVLAEMEMHGVLINADMLKKQSKVLEEKIKALEKQAYQLASQEFNLNSPKQLQTILYETLKLPVLKKTPGGQPSTAEFVLQNLALDYPLPKIILEHRSLSKLKSTYTDRLPEQVHPTTQRIHTSYNQAVTSTGRLSSNHPNLQNIPIRTEEGRKVRQAFIAPPGYRIIAADYSQVELRIIAHISQDPGLITAFNNQLDIHQATAAEVFGVKLADVTPEQRRRAKAINFGLLYGMSEFGLAKQLGVTRDVAQQYIDTYFQRYPKVREYMEVIRKVAKQQGYVETLLGRRLYVPEINATNIQRRHAAERAAINAPMQGTAADIIKAAMILVHEWLKKHSVDAHMIMQVHDELVFEVAQKDLDPVTQQIRYCMENAVQLSVPLSVDIGVGENWDEAH